MSKSGAFLETFKPYRGKYTTQGKGELFDEPFWYTKNERLTAAKIEKAIREQLIIGYFQTFTPHIVGIDIDDHYNRGDAYLLNLYNQVLNRFSCSPSLLAKSPHGLHAYWILSERMNIDVLVNLSGLLLKGIPVEIKPTASTSLRIPAESKMLDPDNLQLLKVSFELWADQVKTYHPAILFDENYLPQTIRENLKTRKASYKKLKALPKIEAVEAELLPLQNGETNDAFLKLCNAYRCAGLNIDEAVYRFQLCLLQSPLYSGDLHSHKRLVQRISCEYKNNQADYVPKKKQAVQIDLQFQLLAADIADILISNKIFAPQRRMPIERFITKILLWAGWHDEISNDRKQTALFDFLYPYYRKNRKAGFYPLPYSFLRSINDRSYEIMPYLESIGFIESAPFSYVPGLGVCKYYLIQKDCSKLNKTVVKYVPALLEEQEEKA